MAIVETPDGLQSGVAWSGWPTSRGSVGMTLYHGRTVDYAALYRSQPNARLCVRFLARNIAQLGMKGYRKVDDAHREELPPDHELSELLASPFSAAPKPPSRHRWVRTMVEDLAIFDRHYAMKVRNPASRRLNLVRCPPQQVEVVGDSLLGPTDYLVHSGGGEPRRVAPEDMFHLWGHDPANPADGVSSFEALRTILAEDIAAGEWRHQFWTNAARIPGYIKRPVEAPKWGDPARQRFSEDWRAQWSGSGSEPGGTPILEEGMEFHEAAFNAEESQYLGARKLTREECAAVFYIPQVFVGLSEGLTFASVKEARTILYVDTLGPWLDWITEEFEAQVLPDLADAERTYVDFNVEAKLAGSFEEQAATLSTAMGAPWLLRNEGRARLNLAPLPEGDELVVPLNVLVGGLASPRDTAPPPPEVGAAARKARGAKALPAELQGWEAKHAEVLSAFFASQRDSVLGKIGAGSPLETAFDLPRWNDVLRDRLLALSVSMAEDVAAPVAADFGAELDVDRMIPWLIESARIAAEEVNTATLEQLYSAGAPRAAARPPGSKALEEMLADLDGLDLLEDETPDDPTDAGPSLAAVFGLAVGARATQLALTRVTNIGQWSRREAAEQAGAGTKTWLTNASPSRHVALHGETVPISANFSNGAKWPGDPVLGADDNAGCQCSLVFGQ